MSFARTLISHLRDVLKKDCEQPHPFLIARAGVIRPRAEGESFQFIYRDDHGEHVHVEVAVRRALPSEHA